MKERLSVYHYRYLPYSETFIYRQLKGLNEYFDLKLLTDGFENMEEFQGLEPLLVRPKTLWEKLMKRGDKFFNEHLRNSDLFHVNFGHVAVEMQRHARKAGIPMTAYFHGVDASALLRDEAYCRKLKKSDFRAVFVCSEDMKRRLEPYLPQNMRCIVVYYGIPLERFPFKRRHTVPEGSTFLQVSRLDYKKGIDITLKAFSKYLKECDCTARLVIAGDGPLKSGLQNLTAALKLTGHVNFLGFVGYEKCIDLLHNADAFLHPSVTADDGDMEGLPNAVCEAMACGLPVIATRHSGIPEAIKDGENGFLVEERDADGLCAKMAALKQMDIDRISNNARARIEEKFDSNKNTSILAEHMGNIISGRL